MKILVLTNYFTPDYSAGSFRMQALLEAAHRHNDQNIEIDIFTTFPNRYGNKDKNLQSLEIQNNVKINRIQVPNHQGKMILQSIAYSVFFFKVLKQTKKENYDLVFATSSRLFTAFLGALIARRNNSVLYLDIRDLFTDTIKDLFTWWVNLPLLPVLKSIEAWTLRSADAVNVVSPGFICHVETIAKRPRISVITNGIDEEFLVNREQDIRTKGSKIKILYAGNVGDGQGLENVVPKAAKELEDIASFKIIGAGSRLSALQQGLRDAECSNVEIIGPMDRNKLILEYERADVLFLHLNDLPAFLKVLPSKIFEYASTRKPIVAGVAGCAKDLLETEIIGSFVFKPNDVNKLTKIIRSLSDGTNEFDRQEFKCRYSRTRLMDNLFSTILNAEKR